MHYSRRLCVIRVPIAKFTRVRRAGERLFCSFAAMMGMQGVDLQEYLESNSTIYLLLY